MKKEEILLWDIKRILLGQAPPEFLFEVFLRTLIVYLATLVVVRLLGKRMSGQLSITEMAVMISFGAIIAVPMQVPERGLVPGLLALLCALVFQRSINWFGFKNRKVEKVTDGRPSLLVKDGIIQLEQMDRSSISRQQLYAVLRNKEIYNMGKVKRLYLEGSGIFSVYEEKSVKPGLPIYPPNDHEMEGNSRKAPLQQNACCRCGAVQESQNQTCRQCGSDELTEAIV